MKRIYALFALIISASFLVIANIDGVAPKKLKWSFDGVFGKFDRTSIQSDYKSG